MHKFLRIMEPIFPIHNNIISIRQQRKIHQNYEQFLLYGQYAHQHFR